MRNKLDDVLKRAENRQDDAKPKQHTLQEAALERAMTANSFNAGTQYDWDSLEAYQRELERLDREGPGVSNQPNQDK